MWDCKRRTECARYFPSSIGGAVIGTGRRISSPYEAHSGQQNSNISGQAGVDGTRYVSRVVVVYVRKFVVSKAFMRTSDSEIPFWNVTFSSSDAPRGTLYSAPDSEGMQLVDIDITMGIRQRTV